MIPRDKYEERIFWFHYMERENSKKELEGRIAALEYERERLSMTCRLGSDNFEICRKELESISREISSLHFRRTKL